MSPIVDTTTGARPVRGDSLTIRRTFSVPSGDTIAKAWFTIKEKPLDPDADAVAQLEITAVSSTAGIIENVGAAGTAIVRFDFGGAHWTGVAAGRQYFYDIQSKSTAGYIQTIERGKVKFEQDYTTDSI